MGKLYNVLDPSELSKLNVYTKDGSKQEGINIKEISIPIDEEFLCSLCFNSKKEVFNKKDSKIFVPEDYTEVNYYGIGSLAYFTGTVSEKASPSIVEHENALLKYCYLYSCFNSKVFIIKLDKLVNRVELIKDDASSGVSIGVPDEDVLYDGECDYKMLVLYTGPDQEISKIALNSVLHPENSKDIIDEREYAEILNSHLVDKTNMRINPFMKLCDSVEGFNNSTKKISFSKNEGISENEVVKQNTVNAVSAAVNKTLLNASQFFKKVEASTGQESVDFPSSDVQIISKYARTNSGKLYDLKKKFYEEDRSHSVENAIFLKEDESSEKEIQINGIPLYIFDQSRINSSEKWKRI